MFTDLRVAHSSLREFAHFRFEMIESGGKPHALQTLREFDRISCFAKRLECVWLATAFLAGSLAGCRRSCGCGSPCRLLRIWNLVDAAELLVEAKEPHGSEAVAGAGGVDELDVGGLKFGEGCR